MKIAIKVKNDIECTGCERYLETNFKGVIFPDSSEIGHYNFAQVKRGHLATLLAKNGFKCVKVSLSLSRYCKVR